MVIFKVMWDNEPWSSTLTDIAHDSDALHYPQMGPWLIMVKSTLPSLWSSLPYFHLLLFIMASRAYKKPNWLSGFFKMVSELWHSESIGRLVNIKEHNKSQTVITSWVQVQHPQEHATRTAFPVCLELYPGWGIMSACPNSNHVHSLRFF